ncbi:MAG: hypothetical protein C6P36_17935 [Geobacillus sp.]|nr:MAG: hypothetical protein C6P36_17935 [Geobacillus sp.]
MKRFVPRQLTTRVETVNLVHHPLARNGELSTAAPKYIQDALLEKIRRIPHDPNMQTDRLLLELN